MRRKVIEEVKKYKYLGYTLQRNRRQETNVKKGEKNSNVDETGLGDWKKEVW